MAEDIGYGIDTSVLAGVDQVLDDTFTEVNDVGVLLEDIYKGTSTPSAPVVLVDDAGPFPLLFWEHPPVSFDLRDFLNASIDASDADVVANRIEAIYDQDLRFDSLDADATFSAFGRTLTVDVRGQASGELLDMRLVVDSNQITVERRA